MDGDFRDGKYLSLATLGLDVPSLAQIRLFVNSFPVARLGAEFPQYPDDDRELRFSEPPDACVIDFDRDPEGAIRVVQRIHELFPSAALLATSWGADPNSIVRAMQCGCRDYLLKPLDQHILLQALSRLAREQGNTRPKRGQILSFIGVKGGCGTTLLAVHLAEFLVKLHGRATLLVDHHPRDGDLALYLDLGKHPYHFRDLLENTHRLDAHLVEGFVVRHSSGLDVLTAPGNFGPDHHFYPEAVEHALEFLRTRYEFVLVDCPPGLNLENMLVAKASDHLYLVATPELPALRRAAKCLQELRRHFGDDRPRVVINRDSTNHGPLATDQAAKLLATKIDWRIPNQYYEVMRTLNLGAPLRSSAEITRSLARWAAILSQDRPGTARKAKNAGRGQDDVLNLPAAVI